MSFSHTVKTELCRLEETDTAHRSVCLYGMLLFLRRMDASSVTLQTEHEGVQTLFAELLYAEFGGDIAIRRACAAKRGGAVVYTVSVEHATDRARLLERFSPDTIDRALLTGGDGCMSAFLRGVFLVAGSCTDPQKEYHLEITSPSGALCAQLARLISELGMTMRQTMRKGSCMLYLKESEHIEDLLTYMGAVKSSIELMNVKIYKDVRNNVNRATNCETANIGKTVDAARRHVEDIQYIMRAGRMENLSEELQELAQLRVENPELSLRELGQLLNTPISRSGVNHRLERLSAIAAELRGAQM